MSTSETKRLPIEIDVHDITIEAALLQIADCLRDAANSMPLLSEIECSVVVEAKRAALHFRAYR